MICCARGILAYLAFGKGHLMRSALIGSISLDLLVGCTRVEGAKAQSPGTPVDDTATRNRQAANQDEENNEKLTELDILDRVDALYDKSWTRIINAVYILGGVLGAIGVLLTVLVPWYSRRQSIFAREHMERRVTEAKSDMKEIVTDAKEDMEKTIDLADAAFRKELAEIEAASRARAIESETAIKAEMNEIKEATKKDGEALRKKLVSLVEKADVAIAKDRNEYNFAAFELFGNLMIAEMKPSGNVGGFVSAWYGATEYGAKTTLVSPQQWETTAQFAWEYFSKDTSRVTTLHSYGAMTAAAFDAIERLKSSDPTPKCQEYIDNLGELLDKMLAPEADEPEAHGSDA